MLILRRYEWTRTMQVITRDNFQHLLTEAHIKPRLKRELRFVPEEISDWEDRDFIAVMNRSRSGGVIVASLERTFVVPLTIQKRVPNRTGRVEAVICDFCATWQRGSNSATITFRKANSTVSFLCCGDLLCSLHVRDKTPAAKLSRTQLRETNDANGTDYTASKSPSRDF